MDLKEKRPIIYSVSFAVIILVLFTVMSGVPLKKLVIPGFFEAEFGSDSETAQQLSGQTEVPGRTIMPIESQTDADLERVVPGTRNQSTEHRTEFPEVRREDSSAYGRPEPAEESRRSYFITGIWYGEDGSVYKINQYDTMVEFVEYGIYGITASGSGSIAGNQISLIYETAFGTQGSAELKISDNSRIITGRANDHQSGGVTQLRLTKE